MLMFYFIVFVFTRTYFKLKDPKSERFVGLKEQHHVTWVQEKDAFNLSFSENPAENEFIHILRERHR